MEMNATVVSTRRKRLTDGCKRAVQEPDRRIRLFEILVVMLCLAALWLSGCSSSTTQAAGKCAITAAKACTPTFLKCAAATYATCQSAAKKAKE
jgi:uncharacterized protein YceK